MDWHERHVLNSTRIFLMENIYDVSSLLDDFIEEGLINLDDAEEITVKPTRKARKQLFLTKLPTWGKQAFKVFVKSLDRNEHEHVSVRLRTELQEVLENPPAQKNVLQNEVPSWVSPQVSRVLVSEKALHLLAQDLSPDQYFLLGSILGLSHARLQHIQAAHPYAPSVQISTMLCEWRTSHSGQANVGKLVTGLKCAGVKEDVYRDIFLEDINLVDNDQTGLINRMESSTEYASGNPEQWV